ncbi:MAG: cohesin domain-containing protein [Clostridiaceae bacterium]
MKKCIQNLLASVFMICILLTTTSTMQVKAATSPDITASKVKAIPGSTVSIVISLDKNPGIWGMGLNVLYDHEVLTLKSYTAGSIFTSGEIIPPQSLEEKNYFFVASRDSLENTKATGTLVTLKFSVAEDADYDDYSISLQLSNENTINNKAQEVDLNCADGNISVIKDISVTSTDGENSETETNSTSTNGPSANTDSKKTEAIITKGENSELKTDSTNEISDVDDSTNETSVTTDVNKTKYIITKGGNCEWKMGSKSGLSITADGNISKFSGIKVDDTIVDKKYYTVASGSTVVTLTQEYLSNLSEGKHILTFVYLDGDANTNLTITKELQSSKTEDNTSSSSFLWIGIIVLVLISVGGILFLYLKKKRTNSNSNN